MMMIMMMMMMMMMMMIAIIITIIIIRDLKIDNNNILSSKNTYSMHKIYRRGDLGTNPSQPNIHSKTCKFE
jgi:hypothetical protein